MQNNIDQPFEQKSWRERVEIVRMLSWFLSITIIPLAKCKAGFRMMSPAALAIMSTIMFSLSAVFHSASGPFPFLMPVYALAVLGMGLWQRHRRWQELCRGEMVMTYSPGTSLLARFPWPRFFLSHNRVARFLDPAAAGIVGAIVGLFLNHILGIWIMVSAFFLHVFEQDAFWRQLNRDLDLLDQLFAADVQAQVMAHFKGSQPPKQAQATLAETVPVATGVDPDIAKQIERRRKKLLNQPANSLVTA
jgi:hypothetical protein